MGIKRFLLNNLRHDRNMKRMLSENAASIAELNGLYNEIKHNSVFQRVEWLKEKVLYCEDLGITDERYCKEEVVVSLTSFGKRINEVYLSIESVMQGTLKPNRIVLWLSESEFKGKTLPITLQKQQKRGLQIEYCEDIRSYSKIVPAMLKYPNACVVTIDDDVLYEFDLLENIVKAHLDCPEDVCACRIHRITLDANQKPNSYMEWQWEVWPQDKSKLNFLTGVGGVLYPAHCFAEEFFNKEAFMSLCPNADDVWINAMILMSERHISKVYTHSKTGCDFLIPYVEQDYALSKENTNKSNCRNDAQINSVFERYGLYEKLR